MNYQKELPIVNATRLELQLKEQRRTVAFDTFDMQAQEILRMVEKGEIWIAPAYQRKFRWDEKRCSQLIESLLLGIPVPSLMMATNDDNTWEVVDGVQRISTLVKFAGSDELREKLDVEDALKLKELQKLNEFESLTYDEFPAHLQQHFKTRPLKVITLNDKSDKVVRFDLFERLNTGGVELSQQEIRDCVFQGEFSKILEELAKINDFKTVVKLTPLQQRDGTAEECVLRFFAFLHRYKVFDHSVSEFLNDYMEDATKEFDHKANESVFRTTFKELARVFPAGLSRKDTGKTTPLNLYEGVAVGAALALQKSDRLTTSGLNTWMRHQELREFTTGPTNSRKAVKGRIEFCRDRFLGKPYVEPSQG